MKKAAAKKLRHIAEDKTIGQPISSTRKLYQKMKRAWKLNLKKDIQPKRKISKRKERLSDTIV